MKAVAITFAALIALVASVAPAQAQNASPKIAVIDVARVFAEMPERDAISQRLEEEFAEPLAQLQQLEEEFEQLRERMQRDQAIMTEEELAAGQEELRQRASGLQRGGEQINQYMQQRESEERNQLLEKMFVVVDAYAAENGYDLIMDKGRMLFSSPAMDISDQIIERIVD
ncbi:MAG: OmpH family outer membrane protein [Idiomarina sp.]|nr:OmpH family outer membrane protein [Idiomarina sp.]